MFQSCNCVVVVIVVLLGELVFFYTEYSLSLPHPLSCLSNMCQVIQLSQTRPTQLCPEDHPFGLHCYLVFFSQLQKCAKISSVRAVRKAGCYSTKEEPGVSPTVHPASIERKIGTAINRTVTVSSKLFSITSVCAVSVISCLICKQVLLTWHSAWIPVKYSVIESWQGSSCFVRHFTSTMHRQSERRITRR